jgi:tripartite-type tricarboxylate transporter receptor subunit TctC
VGEFVPGYAASTWFGVGAPRNTSAGVIERLNREINTTLAYPTVAQRLADYGATVVAGSAADFGTLVANETTTWARVIKAAGTTLS